MSAPPCPHCGSDETTAFTPGTVFVYWTGRDIEDTGVYILGDIVFVDAALESALLVEIDGELHHHFLG